MIHISHLPSVKRLALEEEHGEDVLYQIFFENYPEFDSVKARVHGIVRKLFKGLN